MEDKERWMALKCQNLIVCSHLILTYSGDANDRMARHRTSVLSDPQKSDLSFDGIKTLKGDQLVPTAVQGDRRTR